MTSPEEKHGDDAAALAQVPESVPLIPGIQALRVFLRHRGSVRRVCTVTIDRKDGSLYVTPNRARGQRYFGGRSFFPPDQGNASFDFTTQNQAQGTPKISIHATGQVHIKVAGKAVAGPLWIPPLCELQGAHVATVLPDTIDALPPYSAALADKASQSEHAWLVTAPPNIDNCRLVLRVGAQGSFPEGYLVRPVLARLWTRPVYLGAGVKETKPFNGTGGKGVTLLAGMDPDAGKDCYQHFLWIVSVPPGWIPHPVHVSAAASLD